MAVLLEREADLGVEPHRRESEDERVVVDLPALERTGVVQTRELIVVTGKQDREAPVRFAGEMVVRDRDATARIFDVRIQGVIRIACAHMVGRDRVEEVAP